MESPEPLILHCIQRSWFLYRLLSLCGGALGVNKNDEDLHASEAGSATISWLISKCGRGSRTDCRMGLAEATVSYRRSVRLKPNLVEDLQGPVNTNSTLICAVVRCFLRLGAARAVIGEGPGHQRGTELVCYIMPGISFGERN